MRVVVCDPIHPEGLERLRSAGLEVVDRTEADDGAINAALPTAAAMIVRSATTVSADRLDRAPDLRIVARAGIGVDNIDMPAATERGIQVVNAPTGGVNAVAEHTLALAYALVRELPWTDRRTRRGEWPKGEYAGGELRGSTIGIVGIGRIGRAVAERASALDVGVVGHDPNVDPDEVADLDVRLLGFEACLAAADVLTVHVPLTDETAGMIDADALERLGDAHLINCARGGVVDEGALVDALASGDLAGAAVDVYEDEPLPADHPLCGCERAILTPHVAGASERAQRTIATSVAEQVLAALGGDPVTHPVNDPP